MKKYIVVIADGMADWSLPDFNQQTVMQLASIPHMDELMKHGEIGLVKTVPDGLPAGSDVANLSIFGYDPTSYYRGRAPIEAVNLGINITAEEVVYRANLSYVDVGVMKDFTAGHITSEEARILISDLNQVLGKKYSGVELFPGKSYRNLLKINKDLVNFNEKSTPPHDITDEEVATYRVHEKAMHNISTTCRAFLQSHPVNKKRQEAGKVPANELWFWGQGQQFKIPSFKKIYGLQGGVISALDLINGIGKAAELDIITVPGITGFIDTNFQGKAEYALDYLKDPDHDLVFIHIEAPDEAGHMGDVHLKREAIELIDKKVISRIAAHPLFSDINIMILPDHATPVAIKTHSPDPVPYLIKFSKSILPIMAQEGFCEPSAKASGRSFRSGPELLKYFITP